MKFGDNLKKLRKLKKLSQEDLAEKMQVSRQSVSKWETGDAYPEMNNILELCKIFHCHINELVNDNILDVDSLDEDIKMNVIKFKKEQQVKMKGLSKAICVISKICRIISLVCIPIVLISMAVVGLLISMVEVDDNKLTLRDKDTVMSVVEEKGKISIKVNDDIIGDVNDAEEIAKIKSFLDNNSKVKLLGYVEIGFTFLIINLIFICIMLKALEKLFDNIYKGDTPFTLENVSYIKRIAYLMIVVTVLPNIVSIIFGLLMNIELAGELELFTVVEILFLFSIAYIFQYGYEIQLDSKGRMYGDLDE